MRLKGRHWLLLWLGLFLGVAALITWRQSAAYQLSGELVRLKEQHATLDARRSGLERRIRGATGRHVLESQVAERLGLHVAADSEMTLFPRPRGREDSR